MNIKITINDRIYNDLCEDDYYSIRESFECDEPHEIAIIIVDELKDISIKSISIDNSYELPKFIFSKGDIDEKMLLLLDWDNYRDSVFTDMTLMECQAKKEESWYVFTKDENELSNLISSHWHNDISEFADYIDWKAYVEAHGVVFNGCYLLGL